MPAAIQLLQHRIPSLPAETALAFPAAASRRWLNETADRERFEKPFQPVRNRWNANNNVPSPELPRGRSSRSNVDGDERRKSPNRPLVIRRMMAHVVQMRGGKPMPDFLHRRPDVENRLAREDKPVPTSFDQILLGYEFVETAGGGDHHAILCRRTGKIYFHAEYSDLEEFNDVLPDDVEDGEKYIEIPGKKELGLGKPLVLDFAREFLPDDFDEVRYIFSKRGAYQKFRALVTRRKVLDRWYEFESKATEHALREWCEFNEIEVAG